MEAAVFKFMLFPPDAILPVNLIGGEPHPWQRAHWEVICPAEGMTLCNKMKYASQNIQLFNISAKIKFWLPSSTPTPIKPFPFVKV